MSTDDIGFMKKKYYLSNTPCVWLSVQCVLVVLRNQRTNGPVNAHLKPKIYTNKLV